MKLNEKSLAQFAGSGVPPDKEGLLYKRGDFNRSFQKRWCVLKGNLLFYYEKRGDKEPIGLVVLEGCTIQLCDHEEGFAFMIQFPCCSESKARTYIMRADTQEDMEGWMKMLSCASYEYMRVCVIELKSQLEDANSDQKLLKKVIEDRNSLRDSINSWHNTERQTFVTGAVGGNPSDVTRRKNPFDTSDSLEDDSYDDLSYRDIKQARTFLEMHEEFGQQIRELMEDWRKQQRHSMAARSQVLA